MHAILIALASAVLAASGLPAEGGKTTRPSDIEQRSHRRDCHRDVRTHRIGGVLVRHRHVGPNCEIRVVRKGNSF